MDTFKTIDPNVLKLARKHGAGNGIIWCGKNSVQELDTPDDKICYLYESKNGYTIHYYKNKTEIKVISCDKEGNQN